MTDDVHAPAMAPPVRTDEQILPRIRWVPIGKSNCYLNEEKSQPSPIFKIAVDILKQTNFFRAFTASSTIPAIYIQQFWDTICFDSKAGSYKCQLDEQWFDLSQDTLRDALQITPVDKNRAFSPPPTPDTLIKFVNELGYPREVINLSNVTTNDMFQPWRALATIINLCLTGKTSGFERPRAPVLQILWGVVNRAHIDYAERMWEEFTQSIHNFTEDKRNLAQQAQGKKKATIILIPSIRFTKLIIFHLQRLHNFHPRPESPLHLPTEEPVLGNLKFSAKGTKREVFGMTIPNELINDVIRGADYYEAYLNKVAKHQRYLAGEEKGPKPAPPNHQKKKRKPVSELVDEFIDEGVPAAKPRLEDTKEEIMKKVLQESLTDTYPTQRGPLPHVVFRETDTGKFQPLPEVPGKGKEKVGEEQAAQVLLNLQTPKKKSPTEQYIFQRRSHVPTETAGREDSTSLYARLGLYGRITKQAGPNPDDLLNPTVTNSLVLHWTKTLEHNLCLRSLIPPVIPEEPVSSTGTLSSLQHLAKDFRFGDQFLNDKPSEADNEKTTADTKAESMVSVTVQQDTSVIPPMTSPVIGPVPRPDSPNVHWPLPTTTAATTTTTLPLPPQPLQGPSDPIIIKRMGELEEFIANLVEENQALETRLDKQGTRISKLETIDLTKMIREQTVEFINSQDIDRKINETVKEVVISSVKHDSIRRDEIEDFDVDKAQEETKKKSKQDSPNTPPGSPPSPPLPPPPPSSASRATGTTGASDSAQAPPPPLPSSSTHQGDQSTSTAAPSSSKIAASAEYSAWTITDTRVKPSITTIPDDLYMDDETTADEQAYSSGDEASALKSTYAPPQENSLLAQTGDMVMFMDWYNVSKPLPLGGEPGHVTIQPNFFFNKDMEYLRYGRKVGRPALSILKINAAYYLDVGLEQLVPDQLWIEEECKYDIAAMYGISHWWFQRQRFYIDRFSSEADRRAVRTHMRILSVVQIEVFSMYGYNYMKKIVLRRADLKEYIIAERDFKYMYPSDFEDMYLLNLKGHLNHLSPEDKKILTTAVNLWTKNLVYQTTCRRQSTGN
ncbi:hypothetical protein Tco_0772387 [Tanacetum coccineum]|uniref:Monodehydroascorbate reductase n=1 Tax=Tanacetum coccineum TaxID=301880 RepID=A0ABQ4ZJ55_9ASTR